MLELADIDYHEPETMAMPSKPERYCGRYESFGWKWDIVFEQEKLLASVMIKSSGTPTETLVLTPIDENSFVGYSKEDERQLNVTFLSLDEDGRPGYLFSCYDLCSRAQ